MISKIRRLCEVAFHLAIDSGRLANCRLMIRQRQIGDAWFERLRTLLGWEPNSRDYGPTRIQRPVTIEGIPATLDEAEFFDWLERFGVPRAECLLLLASKYVWEPEGGGVVAGYGQHESFLEVGLKIIAVYSAVQILCLVWLPLGPYKPFVLVVTTLVTFALLHYFDQLIPTPRRVYQHAIHGHYCFRRQ